MTIDNKYKKEMDYWLQKIEKDINSLKERVKILTEMNIKMSKVIINGRKN